MLQDLVGTSNKLFQNLKSKGKISDKQLKYFTYEYKKATNLGKLYLLPKIHKRLPNVPGRPVISNCGTPTEKTSEFLDYHLKPIMQKGKSYIKDSGDFINKIKSIENIPESSILVTADVVRLYPSIPHEAGLNALRETLESRENKFIKTEDLIKMASFVLKNNIFEFNGKVKQQISGTAIGTKFAPAYACIFMDKIENDFLKTQQNTPLVWHRFIDDVFFIWTHGEQKLKSFLESLNTFHPNIKFTHESSKECISFLDLSVSLSGNKLSTDLYIKPTDRHQYLHYSSSHPDHTKKSIIFSQALRLSRLCSKEIDFVKHKEEMKTWFLKRGYPESIIQSEMDKVKFKRQRSARKEGITKGVPLVITYHPLLKSVGNIIRNHLYILYMDKEVKKVFSPAPMVSFKSARKLSSYLVRAKLYPLNRSVGSFKCKKTRCEVCINVIETDTFTSAVTGETFKINHRFDCDEKCLVYLLACNRCGKQDTGQTVDNFRFRWNNYKCCSRKHTEGKSVKQRHLYDHFIEKDHKEFLQDVSITFIDKTDPSDPLKREKYWRDTLKTLAPYGLNISESA